MAVRKMAFVMTVLFVLGGCLLAVGCESLDSTTTTAVGGGAPTEGTPDATQATQGDGGATAPSGGASTPGVSDGTLLGRWYNAISGDVIEFLPDGTVLGTYADTVGGTVYYTATGNQLSLSLSANGGDFFLLDTTFSVDGDTLTIVDGETGEAGTFQRVE